MLKNKLIYSLLGVLVIIKMILVLAYINHGFDFNDEGVMMNVYLYTDEYRGTIQQPLVVVADIFGHLGEEVWHYRLLKNVIEILVGSLLGIILLWYNNVLNKHNLVIVVSAAVLFSQLSILLRIFSFNDFAFLCTCLLMCAILILNKLKGSRRFYILMALSSIISPFVLAPLLITKAPAAILSLGVYAYFLLVHLPLQRQSPKKDFALGLINLVSLSALAFADTSLFFNGNINGLTDWYKNLLPVFTSLGYSPTYLIINGWLGNDVIKFGAFHFIPFIVALGVVAIFLKKQSTVIKDVSLLLIALVTLFFISTLYNPPWLNESRYRIISLAFVLMLFMVYKFIVNVKNTQGNLEPFSFVLIFLIPFIAFVGSNVPFTLSASNYLLPWLMLLVVFCRIYEHAITRRVVFGLTTLFSFTMYVAFGILFPCRNDAPLSMQNNLVETPHGKMYLSDARAAFVKDLLASKDSTAIKNNVAVIPLYNMPGEAYVMGIKSAGLAWYFEEQEGSMPGGVYTHNCYHLNKIEASKKPGLLLRKSALADKQMECIAYTNIGFPNRYRQVFSLYNPVRGDSIFMYTFTSSGAAQ